MSAPYRDGDLQAALEEERGRRAELERELEKLRARKPLPRSTRAILTVLACVPLPIVVGAILPSLSSTVAFGVEVSCGLVAIAVAIKLGTLAEGS